MKRLGKRVRISVNVMAGLVLSVFLVTTAWAALMSADGAKSKSVDVSKSYSYTELGPTDNIQVGPEQSKKSRAPEPSTIALFGSGLFGMIMSFIRRTYAITKRIFDILISLAAFVLLSPLFLFAAVLIKCTSKGPVIFKQIRLGKDGIPFEIYKFRTMRVDAEKYSGPVWAQEDDPRLIPCGKFLRKTHIDEIPQFVNVLKGEMSFIGPRPERPVFVDKLKREIADYEKRLEVKPGITGLAQVWHNYDETISDVRKKIKYDILYIKKLCLWTDLRILFRTFRVVLTGEGAR